MYIVINGGGKVGEYLATVLLRSGHEVAIIERDSNCPMPEFREALKPIL